MLGGGGLVGIAYLIGALAAVETTFGWDARSADVILGTSAGSVVALLLRSGTSAGQLADVLLEPPTAGRSPVARLVHGPPELPPLRAKTLLRRLEVPSLATVVRWVSLGHVGLGEIGADLLGDGELDIPLADGLPLSSDRETWPTPSTWMCSVRRDTLRPVVFGREGDTPPPLTAVAASCAVPGYFQPVEIDGVQHLDGGVRSPTNADLLEGRDLDLALIVAPLGGRDLGYLSVQSWLRRFAHRKLTAECQALEAAGVRTLTLEPGSAPRELMGPDFMAGERLGDMASLAFADAAEQLEQVEAR